MSQPRPAGPHNPDVLLNSVGRSVQEGLARTGWRLGALTLGVDGELRLFVVPQGGIAEQGVELCWGSDDAGGIVVAGLGGAVVTRAGKNPPSSAVLAQLARLAAGSFAALPQPEFELFRCCPGTGETLVFDKQITTRLFGGWLVAGKTGWRGYSCVAMTQDFSPPRLSIRFEQQGTALTVELVPHLGNSGAHRPPGSPTFDVRTRNEAGDLAAVRPGTPGAYLGFLVSRRLGPRTRLVEDPDLVASSNTPPDGGKAAPWEWGKKKGWHRFFHMDEVMELAEVRRVLYGPHAEVVLGERECHNAHPCSYGPRMEVYDFPALAPWPDLYSGQLLASMVSERDLIAGPGPLFKQLLEAAAAVPSCRAVVVADSCVSSLLAEDADQLSGTMVEGEAASATETGENMFLRNEHFYQGLLARGRGRHASKAQSETANLVGYLPGRGREELVGLLAQCGVEVNACFLPDIHLTSLNNFALAAYNVHFPISHRRAANAAIDRASGLPSVIPPSPFGYSGTRDWLVKVASLCGRQEQALEVAEKWLCRSRILLDGVGDLTARTPVAFVVSSDDVANLLEPQLAMGIPLLDVLGELGFPLEILLYSGADRGGLTGDGYRRLQARQPVGTVTSFANEDELYNRLAASAARLVFSDSRCDSRVHRAGKNTFSLSHFEMGFDGSLVTARCLIRRGANPYFARFAISRPGVMEDA